MNVKVFFIDNGNTMNVPFDLIRPCLEKQFVQIPSLVVSFQLDVSSLFIDNVDTKLLKEKLENRIFSMVITNKIEDPMIAKLRDKRGDDM